MQNESSIAAILQSSRTIAVVGMSQKAERASYEVAHYLQQQGYRIVPVNPNYQGDKILGQTCYASLQEAAAALEQQGVSIDIVDCFRQPEAIGQVAEDAIAIGAKCLWLQLGVVNDRACDKASAAGLQTVQDHCMKIEHMKQA
jgi:predicted CoA-binding protein